MARGIGVTGLALLASTALAGSLADRLQRQEGSTWVDVSVEDLRKAEPQHCLEEGAAVSPRAAGITEAWPRR